MPATLSTPPAAPSRTNDTPSEFVVNADAFMAYIEGLSAELNPWATSIEAMVSGVDFNGTSTTSLAVGTGAKTFTANTGKLWNEGQYVIAASAANVANYMVGQVTGYDTGTGQLDVTVASTGGSGTHADWIISLAPAPGDFVTAAGSATLTNKTVSLGSNTVSGTTAQFNTALSDGDFATLAGSETLTNKTINLASNTLAATLAQLNAAVSDADIASLAGSETLLNKTLSDPAIVGCILEDIYTISDGAAFEIDPGNGSIQKITLGASRTPKATNFANGESVTLLVDDGTAYAITWTDTTFGASGVSWLGASGAGSAPSLGTTGLTWIVLLKYNSQVYGMLAGYTS